MNMRWKLIGKNDRIGWLNQIFQISKIWKISVVFLILNFAFRNSTSAHESRPLYIKITEDSTHLNFELNLPNTVNTKNFPIIYLDSISINENLNWSAYPAGFRQKGKISKTEKSLRGLPFKVKFHAFNPVISTILAITFEDKEELILIIPPNEN